MEGIQILMQTFQIDVIIFHLAKAQEVATVSDRDPHKGQMCGRQGP